MKKQVKKSAQPVKSAHKSAPAVQSAKNTKPVKQAAVSTSQPEQKEKKSFGFFPKGTAREDKTALFSFCMGMLVMTCVFVIHLQVQQYISSEQQYQASKVALQRLKNAQSTRPAAVPTRAERIQKCPPVWHRQAQFIPAEYAPYEKKGNLSVSGNVCTALPAHVPCTGTIDVFINPKTSYSDEWWTKHWTGTNGISKTDPRAKKFNIHVTTDENGNFRFKNLPAGDYYIGATISQKNKGLCKSVRLGTLLHLTKNRIVALPVVYPKK